MLAAALAHARRRENVLSIARSAVTSWQPEEPGKGLLKSVISGEWGAFCAGVPAHRQLCLAQCPGDYFLSSRRLGLVAHLHRRFLPTVWISVDGILCLVGSAASVSPDVLVRVYLLKNGLFGREKASLLPCALHRCMAYGFPSVQRMALEPSSALT